MAKLEEWKRSVIQTLAEIRNILLQIKGWESVTENDIRTALDAEAQINDNNKRRKRINEQLTRSRGTTKSEVNERKKLTDNINQIDEENKVLESNRKYSVGKLYSHIDIISRKVAIVEDNIKKVEQCGVNTVDLKKQLQGVTSIVTMVKKEATEVEAAFKLKSEASGLLEMMNGTIKLIEIRTDTFSSVIEELRTAVTGPPPTSTRGGYTVFISNSAESYLRNRTIFADFLSKFDEIINGWRIATTTPVKSWAYIVESKVAKGNITGNIRIIFEIVGNNLIIYEYGKHDDYDTISTALQDGTYKKPQTHPFMMS